MSISLFSDFAALCISLSLYQLCLFVRSMRFLHLCFMCILLPCITSVSFSGTCCPFSELFLYNCLLSFCFELACFILSLQESFSFFSVCLCPFSFLCFFHSWSLFGPLTACPRTAPHLKAALEMVRPTCTHKTLPHCPADRSQHACQRHNPPLQLSTMYHQVNALFSFYHCYQSYATGEMTRASNEDV